MRVSCFFVTVAIMLAGQSAAAPVLGLPSLPLIANEGRLVNSLSATVTPLPILGNVSGDLLESKSNGDLLSNTKLAGPGGLIKEQGRVGEIVGSLHRRQEMALLGTLSHMTSGLGATPLIGSVGSIAPVVNSIHVAELAPVTHSLTSKVAPVTTGLESDVTPVTSGLNLKADGLQLNGVAHKTTDSLPVATNLGSIVKRGGLESAFGAVPGFSQISSMPGISAVESFPGQIASMGSALPMPLPGMTKRSGEIPIIGSLPIVGTIGGIKQVPGISSVPVIGALPTYESLPGSQPISGLGSVPVLGALTSELPLGGLVKRDGALSALPHMGSLPGFGALPTMPSIPTLPMVGSLPSMPSVTSMPGVGLIPALPSVGKLPEVSSLPVVGGLTPGMGSLTSFL